jgi:hypothetical protein
VTLLRVNAEVGTVKLRLGSAWVPLRRPTVREWAEWTDEHRLADADDDDAVTTLAHHEDRLMDGLAGSLNLRIVRTLAGEHPLAGALLEDSSLWLPLANRDLTTQLLMFWQNHPVNPWAKFDAPASRKGKRARPMRSELAGGLGALAVLYRALSRVATPNEIDAMELFQVAMLLGVDDPDRDLDDDEDTEAGPAGGRVVRNRAGATTRMTFTRKPGTPMRFQRRPTVAG